MSRGRLYQLSCCAVPELDSFVGAARRDGLVVRAKAERRNPACVACQRSRFGSRRHVPELDQIINSARRQRAAIAAESNSIDAAFVAIEAGKLLARSRIP